MNYSIGLPALLAVGEGSGLWVTIVLVALIAAAAVVAVVVLVKRKKKGKGCCGGCTSCPYQKDERCDKK